MTRIKVRKKEKSDSKQLEDPKRQKVELKGPRVKHVCRSASIVLGQPLATFPTQEEKENKEKTSVILENNLVLTSEKEKETVEMSPGDVEMIDNKTSQIVSEIPTPKEMEEIPVESKRRKIEPLQPKQAKVESSEDETIIDLIPKKPIMKTLTNITNVSAPSCYFYVFNFFVCYYTYI